LRKSSSAASQKSNDSFFQTARHANSAPKSVSADTRTSVLGRGPVEDHDVFCPLQLDRADMQCAVELCPPSVEIAVIWYDSIGFGWYARKHGTGRSL
jgi:hypothetical protein